jgi:hypothetical protein
VGWDVPLARPDEFAARLRQVAAMDDAAHAAMRRAAREYAARWRVDPVAVEQNRTLFRHALGMR